jgi:hypothetical protein
MGRGQRYGAGVMSNLFATRAEARANGAKQYFTGEACKSGHVSPRFTINGRCYACSRASFNAWRAANLDVAKALNRKSKEANPERVKRNRREHYVANRDKEIAQVRAWQASNPERVKILDKRSYYANIEANRQQARLWARANPQKRAASLLRYHYARQVATLTWFDAASTQSAYAAAQFMSMVTGEWYNVDHIVPLQSPKLQSLSGNTFRPRLFVGPLLPVVQGFHHAGNLQVIPRAHNQSKSNRVWPNMPYYKGL